MVAHSIPLHLSSAIFARVVANLEEVVASRQLLLLPSADFVLADARYLSREILLRHHRRLLRKNMDLQVRRSTDVERVIADWAQFCAERSFSSPSAPLVSLLRTIYAPPGFIVKEFWDDGTCVVSSLILFEEESRVFFDILAPWKSRYAARRPGIYSAVHNLMEAFEINARYSLCYGRFPYKEQVVLSTRVAP